jgi:hypothetical protein
VYVHERYLVLHIDPVETGGVRFAVGDIDGDGAPEAVAVTNYRDGGLWVRPEITCVSVADGRVRWRAPISRVWLGGDTIIADIDGDGPLEAIVSTFYPTGYMHVVGAAPWADVHVVRGDGEICFTDTFPDGIISPKARGSGRRRQSGDRPAVL